MARHIDAWMDGTRLSDLGAVFVREVDEPAPEMEIEYVNRLSRGGRGVSKRKRRSLQVTLHVAVHELFDLKKRADLRDAVAQWANGSVLELSNHPDRRLNVISLAEPALGDVRDFNATLDVNLEANVIPYWESKTETTVSGSGTSGSATLRIPGTAKEVPVDVTVDSGTGISSLTVSVSCGGVTKSISLSGMSSVSGAITFSRDADDRLQIRSGTTDLLPYRTAASADDLVVPAGTATVSWTASASRGITFSARGRWL